MRYFKKIICLAISLVFIFALASCSGNNSQSSKQAAFISAQNTYNSLINAYEKIDIIASDVYESWRIGIYETASLSALSETLNLSSTDLNSAADSLVYPGVGNSVFYSFGDTSKFNICIALVKEAYALNGTYDAIEALLNTAKIEMKTMSEQYSDYEHYSNLKHMYSVVDSYYDFCKDPTGSFEQAKTTINDYRNDIRDLESDLAYIFEEF